MKTWQIEPNAWHYTKEKLSCSFCKKQVRVLVQTEEYFAGFNCCLIENLNGIFEGRDFILMRMIEDILFDKRKEIRKKEREKLTLKLRYEIFQRDGFKCAFCGKTGKNEKIEIDHILPVSKGGKTIKSNLRVLCFKCNRGKSNATENCGGILS